MIFAAKTREANITRRKPNITAQQYHSPQANITEKDDYESNRLFRGGGCGIRTHVRLLSNGFQEVYQRIPFQLSSVQFVLKQFPKILILQGFFGLFGTVLN